MSVQVEKLEHNMVKLTVEVPEEEFDKAVNKAYQKNKNRINIPGFRKGKVPRQIIEKMYGKDFFYGDAANIAVPEAYEKAYQECGEDIVSYPQIEVTQLEVGKPMIFTAEVAVNPTATVKNYKGIKIEKFDATVSDEDVDKQIERDRDAQARFVSVEREAKNGDEVIFDYEGFVDGEAFDGGKDENHSLTLGSGAFIPGFEDQIVGHKADEEFDVNVTFPEDYHAEHLKGKAAVFKCKLHEIKEKQIPELDDAFADDAGFDTIDEYKADVRKKLEERKAAEVKDKKESAVIDKLIEEMEADIPEAMYEYQTQRMIDEYGQQLAMQGLSLKQYLQITGLTEEKLKEEYRPGVERRVKARLAMEAVAKAENITASDEDFEKEIEEMAKRYRMEVANLKDVLPEKEQNEIRKDIVIKKALEFVTENAAE